MTEQIYINGILMDQSSGKALQLVYQSPFFTDLDSIVSNRTNSVDFPVTPNNMRAVEMAMHPESASLFGYRRHTAVYFRDGIQVFVGYGTLLALTPTAIRFSFVWGNISVFQTLFEHRIRDLATEEDYIEWTEENCDTKDGFSEGVSFGVGAPLPHPFVSVADIIDRIETREGISIGARQDFDEYYIPVLGRTADETAALYQQFCIATGRLVIQGPIGVNQNPVVWAKLAPAAADRDLEGLYDSVYDNGIYDVDDIDALTLKITAGLCIRTTGAYPLGYILLRVIAVDEDADPNNSDNRYIHDIQLTNSYTSGSGTSKVDDWTLTSNVSVDLDVSNYKYIVIVVASDCQAASIKTMSEVKLLHESDGKVLPGGLLPTYKNLPDWTESQLLKNIMKMQGLFAVCPDSSTINLVSIADLYTRRNRALDWSERLLLTDGLPEEQTMDMDGFAQINNFRYAEDEDVGGICDGSLPVDNDTIEKEKDVVTLDFGASPGDRINLYSISGGGVSEVEFVGSEQVDLYSEDSEDEVDFNDSCLPRIFRDSFETDSHGRPILTFEGLDWPAILEDRYEGYADIIFHPKVVKAKVRITSAELAALDLTVPVYSHALGHYYAILKLTTKSDGLAEVRLLQL